MARNIRWQVTFKSLNGTTCRVNIYDNDWPASTVMPVRGAADPFFFEEDNSDDILNDVIRYRTGYIRIIENYYGELDAIYPSSIFDRYVEFLYGSTVMFTGYIQLQDISNTLEFSSVQDPCPREVELPVISPLGLYDQRTFTVSPTPFNPPTTVTLGELLDIAMNLGAYEKVTFPDITGTGFDKTVFSLVVCPFNSDYHHSITSNYMDRMFAPQTYAYFIEAICKAFGWICHDTPQALVFTSFDHKGLYAYYPKGHIGETNYKQSESVSQAGDDIENHFTFADSKPKINTILPDTGIAISYEGDDGNPDFTFDRTYFNGVAQQNAQDPREITSICNLIAPLQLHEVVGCGSLSFDSSGKVNPGIGIVAWNGYEGVLISASSSWADGKELFAIRLYRKMLPNYSFSLSYDIMTSVRNISALENDDEEATLAHFYVTFNSAQDYIEAHFIYHYGQTIQGGTLLPLDDNFLVFIHNISFEWYLDDEPYASYKYLPASKGDTIPSTGNPAISSSITMPISLYRFNDRMIGDTVLTTKVTEYPYLFQRRTELDSVFRGTAPNLYHAKMWEYLGKKWRIIAQTFHPWSDECRLTLQSSPVLDGLTHTITASAANTSLDGYSDTVNDGTSFSHLLSAITGYSIASVTITMGGVDITSTAYNSSTGQIYITSVTGNVVITEVAELTYDAEVEYLGTDGNAYINIGIKAASTVQFNLDMYLPSSSANSWAFGGRYSSSQRMLCVLFDVATSGKVVWRFGNTTNNCSAISAGNYNLNNMTAARTLQVNGSSYNATNSTFSTDAYIYLFTCNNNNNNIVNSPVDGMRFFKGKFYSSGTLVRDFIPVRKDGVGYLYDKVSGQLFGNANSSGSFTYGPDKNS